MKESISFYEGCYKYLGNVRAKIAEEHGISEGHVLDIGTGDGFFAIALAKNLKQGEVIGIDLVGEWIKDAKANVEHARVQNKCKIIPINFWENNFPDNHFDMVTTFLALCNLVQTPDELLRAFSEIFRILKSPGKLILAEATPEDAENYAQKLGFEINKELNYCYFSKEQILQALKSSSFKPETASFYKTGAKCFGCEDFKQFLKEEVSFGNIDNTIKSDWKDIYNKYTKLVDKTGVEFDSKITVITGIKKQ